MSMTNQQGAPEAPSYEHQRAIMEGERNASLDAYSRVVYLTQTESRIYEAAFTNGWNRLAALVEAQQPAPSAAAAPVAVKAMGYGGSTGINDYLMSDGTVKAMRPAEVKWAPQPSPTPQADSQPAPDPRQQLDAYYSLLDAMGWESKRQHISPETWAADLLRDATAYRAARAPADSVTAPAGCNNIPGMAEKALAKLKSHIDHVAHKDGHWETRHLKDSLFDLEWIVRRKLTPTPPAQAADPLQGAANWLAEAHGQFCVAVLQGCLMIGYNRAKRLHDAALAARKQGANHD